jgi:fumarylacetoacetate (FAA) hydrolase family protein
MFSRRRFKATPPPPPTAPEVFFKGPSRVCVGPNAGIGVRADSNFTAPEPELAVVLGSYGRIVGYTISNDVSAWTKRFSSKSAKFMPSVYRKIDCALSTMS